MKHIYILLLSFFVSNSFASMQEIELLAQPKKINESITAVASYSLYAVVLKRENYYFDKGKNYSKVDFALGWDKMILKENYQHIDIKQSHRWYFWRPTKNNKLSSREISTMSSNHHMIAKNPMIAKRLSKIQEGDYIKAQGYLINISEKEGFRWNTSVTNLDSGDGACELFYVTELIVNPS